MGIILRDGLKMSYLNLSLEGVLRAAQDTEHWKTMIRGPNAF